MKLSGLLWRSSDYDSGLPLQDTQVWSLVGELTSCLSHTMRACMLSQLSHVRFFATPWTVARQAPLSLSVGFSRPLEWVGMPSSRGSSQPRDQTQVSCIGGRFFTTSTLWEAHATQCTTPPQKKRQKISFCISISISSVP